MGGFGCGKTTLHSRSPDAQATAADGTAADSVGAVGGAAGSGAGGSIPANGGASSQGGALGNGGAAGGQGGAPGNGGTHWVSDAANDAPLGGQIADGAGQGGTDGVSTVSKDAPAVDAPRPDATGIDVLDSDFCTGDVAKVSYAGKEIQTQATNYRSALVFDCCNAFGINLRTTAALGWDLQVEIIVSAGSISAGTYVIDPSSFSVRASVRTGAEGAQAGHRAVGSVRLAGDLYSSQGAQVGLCLEVDDSTSTLLGTRIYVPNAMMVPPSPWTNRLQMYLLQDSTLTSQDVAAMDLASLTLATTPLLTLGQVAFFEQSTGWLGLNPGQKTGDSLRTKLGRPNLAGLPFVVVADEVRIYLGSFMTAMSSMPGTGPMVTVEDIAADGFAIAPTRMSRPVADPRDDARILQVFQETGKLLP
jgi:hypothetical protein